jgi:hypothetical protein
LEKQEEKLLPKVRCSKFVSTKLEHIQKTKKKKKNKKTKKKKKKPKKKKQQNIRQTDNSQHNGQTKKWN